MLITGIIILACLLDLLLVTTLVIREQTVLAFLNFLVIGASRGGSASPCSSGPASIPRRS